MILLVLGSSSAGNAYLLRASSGETLLIECGLKRDRLLEALDFDLEHLAACLLSHEHGDHAREARWITDRHIPLFCSRGTAEALGLEQSPLFRPLTAKKIAQVGSFSVLPFDARHDAREPLGFLIDHPEMGRLCFLTDSYLLRYRFPAVTFWMIECNYQQDVIDERLQRGLLAPALYHRLQSSHMSLDTCRKTLLAQDLTPARRIVLLHLSHDNASPEECRWRIEDATGRPVLIAEPDLPVCLDLTPF